MFIKKLTLMGLGLFLGISSVQALEKVPLNSENINPNNIYTQQGMCRCGFEIAYNFSCEEHTENPGIEHLHRLTAGSLEDLEHLGWSYTQQIEGFLETYGWNSFFNSTFSYGADSETSYSLVQELFLSTKKKERCSSNDECVEFCNETVGRQFDKLYEVAVSYEFAMDMIGFDNMSLDCEGYVTNTDLTPFNEEVSTIQTCNGESLLNQPCNIAQKIECVHIHDLPGSTMGTLAP